MFYRGSPRRQIKVFDPSVLRVLDDHGTTIGTVAARWMQYLAHEAMCTRVIRHGYTAGRQLERLHVSLSRIDASATVLDRYLALAGREDQARPW